MYQITKTILLATTSCWCGCLHIVQAADQTGQHTPYYAGNQQSFGGIVCQSFSLPSPVSGLFMRIYVHKKMSCLSCCCCYILSCLTACIRFCVTPRISKSYLPTDSFEGSTKLVAISTSFVSFHLTTPYSLPSVCQTKSPFVSNFFCLRHFGNPEVLLLNVPVHRMLSFFKACKR